MTTVGFCTHLCQSDDWAFDYAFNLVQAQGWHLVICHWLASPYRYRRDLVPDDLLHPQQLQPLTPELLNRLEYQLRQYYDARLGDFTDVAFKLCEGMYQIELKRCLRQHLLDVLVMGYQSLEDSPEADARSMEAFAASLPQPVVLVGHQGPGSYLINPAALAWLDRLRLPEGQYQVLQAEGLVNAP